MVLLGICSPSAKLCGSTLVLISKQSAFLSQIHLRQISSKVMRHRNPPPPKPAPFPYKEKKYNFWRALFDPTESRLDENSKLIVVEGPPAAGKGALAKKLAEDLDMAYFPAPTVASTYINDYGVDLRQADPKLPLTVQSYDENDFLKDPTRLEGTKAGRFQLTKFQLKYKLWMDALAHILNSGQGVVMDRSPFSDFVYIEAMCQTGIVSQRIKRFYHEVKQNCMYPLWRPHLVIYLDVPAEQARRKIEARNIPHEKNSLAASVPYLQALENAYKQNFLKEITTHSEVLIYDWSDGGDTEILIEDIERINFDQYTIYDTRMDDWRCIDKWDWNYYRHKFSNNQDELMLLTNVPGWSYPEILIPAEDRKILQNVMDEVPGNKYAKGFNPEMGDKGILFKLS